MLCTIAFAQQKAGIFTDPRDGKKYRTVKIGNQTWMAENLNYHGSDGYLGLCYGDEPKQGRRKPENCRKYGRLYDKEEAQKACPSGWHLPSDKEWQTLVNFAGGNEVAGKKLKAKKGWHPYDFSKHVPMTIKFPLPKQTTCKWIERDNRGRPIELDECSTDEFGFSAMPGGYSDGFINYGGTAEAAFNGYWWGNPHCWTMSFTRRNLNIDTGRERDLNSVRCVKDEDLLIKVESNAIFIDNNKIANTTDVARQEDILINELSDILREKKDASDKCQIQIDPNQRYNVLFKIMATCGSSGYTDVHFISTINGKKHTEQIAFPKQRTQSEQNKGISNNFNLIVSLTENYIEVRAGEEDVLSMILQNKGSVLNKIFHNEEGNSAYDELKKTLVKIHERSINASEANSIIILSVNDNKVSKILSTMRIAREAGFHNINLSILAGN